MGEPQADAEHWRREKCLFPAENQILIPQLSSPQPSHYTDWAVVASFESVVKTKVRLFEQMLPWRIYEVMKALLRFHETKVSFTLSSALFHRVSGWLAQADK
jgi:hypothetical protein